MLISITSSTVSRYGNTASTGVSRLSVRPTPSPAPRAFAIDGAGSGTASRWKLTMSRPASRSSAKNPSRGSTIRRPCSGRSVTGRRLDTITAPSAIGGTKWPSMMSTWNTPTCGSTATTCAPRFAKSAARIDAATVPIGRNGTGRDHANLRTDDLRRPLEGGDEHAVAPVAMGPEPMALGGPAGAVGPPPPQARASAQQRVAHGIGFPASEGADRVDEPPVRAERGLRGRHDRELPRRQGAHAFLRPTPQELAAPASRAEPAAQRAD